MNFQYSKELVKQLQENFKEEHNVNISEETANEYLNSFADLYEALAKPNKPKEN